MQRFTVRTANAGLDEVQVAIIVDPPCPIEFEKPMMVQNTNTAIFANHSEVRFRLMGAEPSEWMTLTARRHTFSTAARSFDTGA